MRHPPRLRLGYAPIGRHQRRGDSVAVLTGRRRHPTQAAHQHCGADGSLYFEELMGEEGFSSDSSLVYHLHIPSGRVDSRVWDMPDQTLVPNHSLTPRHLSAHKLFEEQPGGINAVTGRRLLLGNGDVRIGYVVADSASPYYRNAIGDECLFIEGGAAQVETVFGDLAVGQGDYVLVPRAATYRVLPKGTVRIYAIEGNGHIGPPARYLSKRGQLLEHAPYCERDFRAPTGPRVVNGENIEVYIKHRGRGPAGVAGTIHTLPYHPFDVVGWDGCLYPYTFNVEDFMPITGKVHQPPPAHQPGFRS